MLAFYFKKLTNRLTLMVKKILLSLIGVLVFAAGAFAQAKQVRGSVVDENGAAVIGASVIVKGTTIGVSTDQQGFFVMNNVPA
ncbi:carboxypeptidase-like regulatory domain-containing protein, partial [Alistipes finegoldii]